MSYVPLYTSVDKVSSLVQVDIDTTSVPKIDEVLTYIQESEAKIIDRGLGLHNATNMYIDIPSIDFGSQWPIFNMLRDTISFRREGLIVPIENIKQPIIAITSLFKNEQSIGAVPRWESLTQWTDNAASDFYLLKTGIRQLGYALFIYNRIPIMQGTARLKMNYTYGYNVPTAILADYTTLDVGIRVLTQRMGTNELDGLSRVYGNNIGNALVTNYSERIQEMKEARALIEIMHFPNLAREAAPSVAII
jgi:hypothetical protein